MRSMNRYFDDGQHLHGSLPAANQHCRAWALLFNFTPWSAATAKANEGWRCPAERFNRHRYHDCWLQNLALRDSWGDQALALPKRSNTRSRKFLKLNIP